MKYSLHEITQKCTAIVMFGPPGDFDGFKSGTYYQVTIDSEKISPSGDYIRFGSVPGDEIMGWQRCEAITVVEILGEWVEGDEKAQSFKWGEQAKVAMMMKEANG